MDKTWDLRDELYHAFHRWPLLVACFALGALLGWLAAYLWPSYTRSTQTIYVGLNPYRAYSDSEFLALARPKYSNLDNYQYWQMSQLETVILGPVFLEKTLASLRQQDTAWEQIDEDGLRSMLDTEWRTAGDWDLVAADRQAKLSRQAVQAWSAVVMEQVKQAVDSSQQAFMLDERLQEAGAGLQTLQRRYSAVTAAGPVISMYLSQLGSMPADQSVDPGIRYRLSGVVTEMAGDDAGWAELLANQPAADTSVGQTRAWLEQVHSRAEMDATRLPGQINELQSLYTTLQEQYRQAQDASLSLSPNIAIDKVSPVHSELVRPASLLALIGGFVGLLAWVLLELVRISRWSRSRG